MHLSIPFQNLNAALLTKIRFFSFNSSISNFFSNIYIMLFISVEKKDKGFLITRHVGI